MRVPSLLPATGGTDSCEDAVYKNMRRAVMTLVSKEACARHVPVQAAEASQLMYDLLKRPEACPVLLRR